jgi:hypothetical protein
VQPSSPNCDLYNTGEVKEEAASSSVCMHVIEAALADVLYFILMSSQMVRNDSFHTQSKSTKPFQSTFPTSPSQAVSL